MISLEQRSDKKLGKYAPHAIFKFGITDQGNELLTDIINF